MVLFRSGSPTRALAFITIYNAFFFLMKFSTRFDWANSQTGQRRICITMAHLKEIVHSFFLYLLSYNFSRFPFHLFPFPYRTQKGCWTNQSSPSSRPFHTYGWDLFPIYGLAPFFASDLEEHF